MQSGQIQAALIVHNVVTSKLHFSINCDGIQTLGMRVFCYQHDEINLNMNDYDDKILYF